MKLDKLCCFFSLFFFLEVGVCGFVCVIFGLTALRVALQPNARMPSSKQRSLTNIRSRTLVHVHIFKVMNVR